MQFTDAQVSAAKPGAAVCRAGSIVVLGLILVMGPGVAAAQEDAADACREAANLIESGDLDGALDEAQWCVESLQQMKQQQTLAIFPDEVAGYIGGETSSQNTLGMKMIEREYSKDSQSISVSLMGGGNAGAGLAALAQLGLQFGSQSGKKIRIQRRTVVDMSDGGDAQMMVQLRSGGTLNVTSGNVAAEGVMEFLKAFPIADLDDALKSQ